MCSLLRKHPAAPEPLVKLIQGQAGGTFLNREHQPHLEIRCYLLQVLGCKVGAVVCVEDVGHAADLPVRMPFTPYPLPQSERGPDGRRRVKFKIIASDRPTVIVDHDRKPRPRRRSILLKQLDVQLSMICLPDGVRFAGFPPMDQIEALAV